MLSLTGDGGKAVGASDAHGKHRRRPSTPQETARRKAWGEKWGAVGKAWKQAHNPKGS